jgi:hypothetical protein
MSVGREKEGCKLDWGKTDGKGWIFEAASALSVEMTTNFTLCSRVAEQE